MCHAGDAEVPLLFVSLHKVLLAAGWTAFTSTCTSICAAVCHAGDVEVPLLVRFAAPENRALQLQPVQLSLTATGRELPVSTLTPLVDFK